MLSSWPDILSSFSNKLRPAVVLLFLDSLEFVQNSDECIVESLGSRHVFLFVLQHVVCLLLLNEHTCHQFFQLFQSLFVIRKVQAVLIFSETLFTMQADLEGCRQSCFELGVLGKKCLKRL